MEPYGFLHYSIPQDIAYQDDFSFLKCALHKCEMITISGIKNVNDECYASSRMIK